MAESLTIKIHGDIKEFQAALKGTQAATAELQRDLTNIAAKATIAFAGLSATITGLIATYRTQEQAEKKLETALASTGNAAGLTADELKQMASSLQSVSTFGDEAVIESQALLLTFTKVGKDVFPKATESILNMSAAMGTDLKSSTIMIGKALNDPIAGVTALSRAGVQLTEDQKELIKYQTEFGDIAKAQTIILKELETQFGGQARATAEGTGRFIQLSNTLGDMAEVIGKHLVPPLAAMAKKFNEILVDILGTKGDQFGKTAASILLIATNATVLTTGLALTAKGLIAVRAAVKGLGLSLKGLRATLVSTGIGAIIVGFSIAIETFVMDFDKNMKIVMKVWTATSTVMKKVWDATMKYLNDEWQGFILLFVAAKELIGDGITGVANFFKNLWEKIRGINKQGLTDYKDSWNTSKEEIKTAEGEWLESMKEALGEYYIVVKELIEGQKEFEEETARAKYEKLNELRLQGSKKEKKILIDHEKFIMSAQKRETLDYLKNKELQKKADEKRSKERKANLKSTLGTISTLQSSSNQDLFNIGRAGALAMAYIDGKAAVIKALASAPPPFNFALATAVGLAVAAQIGEIVSAKPPKMNDGGMIMGSPGIDQNLAMLSRGELVVPTRNFEEVVGGVSGNRDADIFGESQTVNVSISFEGDEASQVLTAHQIEDRALGVSREEVA